MYLQCLRFQGDWSRWFRWVLAEFCSLSVEWPSCPFRGVFHSVDSCSGSTQLLGKTSCEQSSINIRFCMAHYMLTSRVMKFSELQPTENWRRFFTHNSMCTWTLNATICVRSSCMLLSSEDFITFEDSSLLQGTVLLLTLSVLSNWRSLIRIVVRLTFTKLQEL